MSACVTAGHHPLDIRGRRRPAIIPALATALGQRLEAWEMHALNLEEAMDRVLLRGHLPVS